MEQLLLNRWREYKQETNSPEAAAILVATEALYILTDFLMLPAPEPITVEKDKLHLHDAK
jgi:hypothetical protein